MHPFSHAVNHIKEEKLEISPHPDHYPTEIPVPSLPFRHRPGTGTRQESQTDSSLSKSQTSSFQPKEETELYTQSVSHRNAYGLSEIIHAYDSHGFSER